MQAVIKAAAGPGFRLADVPEPEAPAAGDCLLRVLAASVCGSDVHLFDWNPWAAARVRPPRIIGHEICGEVVQSDGDGPAVGTVVAVESHIVCHRCTECLRGDFHVCANTRILGVDVDGGFTTQVVVPVENVRAVAAVEPEVIAALEPLGNAVHACSYGSLREATVVVFGCGPIGCACVAVARAEGARRIIAVDRNDYRLAMAERMGADALVRSDGGDLVARLRREAGAGGIDCALEMSGAPSAIVAATGCVRPGGWISLLGIGDGEVSLDLSNDVVMKGLTLFGVVGRRLPQTWDTTLDHLRSGTIDVGALITHRFPMSEIEEAITLIKSGRCGKVSLTPG